MGLLKPIQSIRSSANRCKELKEVEKAIVRVIRFAKWLRFYDKQIATGDNTKNFRKGIEFILKL